MRDRQSWRSLHVSFFLSFPRPSPDLLRRSCPGIPRGQAPCPKGRERGGGGQALRRGRRPGLVTSAGRAPGRWMVGPVTGQRRRVRPRARRRWAEPVPLTEVECPGLRRRRRGRRDARRPGAARRGWRGERREDRRGWGRGVALLGLACRSARATPPARRPTGVWAPRRRRSGPGSRRRLLFRPSLAAAGSPPQRKSGRAPAATSGPTSGPHARRSRRPLGLREPAPLLRLHGTGRVWGASGRWAQRSHQQGQRRRRSFRRNRSDVGAKGVCVCGSPCYLSRRRRRRCQWRENRPYCGVCV